MGRFDLTRFAVISDVHGNRWALEAVLEDIDKAGISEVLNLGDVFYGPLDPAGTADILSEKPYLTVCGNEDRIITERNFSEAATLTFVREQLDRSHMAWLRSLESEIITDSAYLCHGSPGSDTAYLLWDIGESGVQLRNPDEISEILSGIDRTLILCGHDHVPRTMSLPGGRTLVNPGSVGLPAYWDDNPHPHIMETGTPQARYAVVSKTASGWSVDNRAISYDWQSAVDAAFRNGRPDWARWLETGHAQEYQMDVSERNRTV